MGLDATVYCNCYEAGTLRAPPPRPDLVYVADCGALECRDGGDDQIYFEFERWLQERACAHAGGILLHHRVGNIALVALLRSELARSGQPVPLLLGRVLYSGTHGGDFLDPGTVRQMRGELGVLGRVTSADGATEAHLRAFEQQMAELVECALRVNKPIAF